MMQKLTKFEQKLTKLKQNLQKWCELLKKDAKSKDAQNWSKDDAKFSKSENFKIPPKYENYKHITQHKAKLSKTCEFSMYNNS
jgi:hypothetical protein